MNTPLLSTVPLESETSAAQSLLERFDAAPLGKFHIRLVVITGLNWAWVAYGVTIISFLLPGLRSEFNLSSSQLGLIASVTLVGMMVGSVFAGTLADRIGRRLTLVLIMGFLVVFSALTSLAWSYASLLVLRGLYGLGLGAVLPVASTLVSEYSPSRYRGRLTVILNGFWGVGMVLAALVGEWLVPLYGWRLPLLFASVGIISVPLNILFLPESLRFLISKGKLQAASQVAGQIEDHHAIAPPGMLGSVTPPPAGAPLASSSGAAGSIWSLAYRTRTLALWLMWFALNFTFQGVFIWLPTILVANGNSMAQSFWFTIVITAGYVPGTLLAAYLADFGSRRRSMAAFMIGWGLASLIFGFSRSPLSTLIWGFLVATGNGAAWGMAYPVTTELYPTRMRAAATGWASGFGRVGGIVAPFVVGLLLQLGIGTIPIFALLGAVPMLSTLVLIGLSQATTGKALEQITR